MLETIENPKLSERIIWKKTTKIRGKEREKEKSGGFISFAAHTECNV